MTIIWCVVLEIWSTTEKILCHFGPFFALLTTKNPEIKILKNWKTPGDIMILHKFTKNHYHMLHCSWDMMCDGCIFFHFGLFFVLLPPPNESKNKKNRLEITFYTCIPKIRIAWCTVPEIWCATEGRMEKVTYRGGCPT